MKDVLDAEQLYDQGVLVEYRLPGTSLRIDCMVTGVDASGNAGTAIVELKQWEKTSPADGEYVLTFVGGGEREVLHPSVQAAQYRRYLLDMHGAFYGEEAIQLSAFAFLHNYRFTPDDSLFDPKFEPYLAEVPVIGEADTERLAHYLGEKVGGGVGLEVLERVRSAPHGPSKQLMDHVARMIHDSPEYILLDDQLLVYDKIRTLATRALRTYEKHAVIVHGGPGTGKSVLATRLTGDLLREGVVVNYATGSKAFTQTLWKKLGARAKPLFRYFNNYTTAKENAIDLLIMDEAHRIRRSSNSRYTRAESRSDKLQIEELLHAGRVSVFFIDEAQNIRPDEIGNAALIREHAAKRNISLTEMRLEAQFRCSGSDRFVNWIDHLLGIRRTANPIWNGDPNFGFEVMANPEELERRIGDHDRAGARARLVAGFCWPWTVQPDEEGELIRDVKVGNFERAWNRHDDAKGVRRGIPKAPLWASDPGGRNQVGCIYTAQGFEFDYVGVIWGPDLKWDADRADWVGDAKASHDSVAKRAGAAFAEHAKHAYRVLLSRGIKGCYVYFMDKTTERFVKSRIETPVRPVS